MDISYKNYGPHDNVEAYVLHDVKVSHDDNTGQVRLSFRHSEMNNRDVSFHTVVDYDFVTSLGVTVDGQRHDITFYDSDLGHFDGYSYLDKKSYNRVLTLQELVAAEVKFTTGSADDVSVDSIMDDAFGIKFNAVPSEVSVVLYVLSEDVDRGYLTNDCLYLQTKQNCLVPVHRPLVGTLSISNTNHVMVKGAIYYEALWSGPVSTPFVFGSVTAVDLVDL